MFPLEISVEFVRQVHCMLNYFHLRSFKLYLTQKLFRESWRIVDDKICRKIHQKIKQTGNDECYGQVIGSYLPWHKLYEVKIRSVAGDVGIHHL